MSYVTHQKSFMSRSGLNSFLVFLKNFVQVRSGSLALKYHLDKPVPLYGRLFGRKKEDIHGKTSCCCYGQIQWASSKVLWCTEQNRLELLVFGVFPKFFPLFVSFSSSLYFYFYFFVFLYCYFSY